MEDEAAILPKDERIQLEYLESLLSNLTMANMEKVVRKINNVQFKTRDQLQHLSDLIFKFVLQRPEKISEYAYLCKEIKDLKVTILRFETVDEKESLEIANLRFHILLTTRVEIAYDQLGAVKDGFELFSKEMQTNSLNQVLRLVKNQIHFVGELYKHELVMIEFVFAMLQRLSVMAKISEFFLECMVSFMEQTAKDVEGQNHSMGRYFKHLKNVVLSNKADGALVERIRNLLKLRASKWLDGEEEVPPEHVESIEMDEDYKERTLKGIEEELTKYISLDRCRSCCIEFEKSDRISHLISKQHTASIQTLLRDQYHGNLISCRERTCVMCQEPDIEKPFSHFLSQKHKINTTTFCYICQTKFSSAFYLAMHLKSLTHRMELLRMYDSILKTTFLDELSARENDILADSDSDDTDDNALLNDEEVDRLLNENSELRDNIYKYFDLITAEDNNKDEQELHQQIVEQLDKFIENIYISKNISIEHTLELLRHCNQEVEDVKATIKCAQGELPLVGGTAKERMVAQPSLINLLTDQYMELCQDMKKKLSELKKVETERAVQETDDEPLIQDTTKNKVQTALGDSKSSPVKQKCQSKSLPQRSNEDLLRLKTDNNQDIKIDEDNKRNVGTGEKTLATQNLIEKNIKSEEGVGKEIQEKTSNSIDDLKKDINTKNMAPDETIIHTDTEDRDKHFELKINENITLTSENISSENSITGNNTPAEINDKPGDKNLKLETTSVDMKSNFMEVRNKPLSIDNRDNVMAIEENIGPSFKDVNLPSTSNIETKFMESIYFKDENKESGSESLEKSIDSTNKNTLQQQATISKLKVIDEYETKNKNISMDNKDQDKNIVGTSTNKINEHEICKPKKDATKSASKNRRIRVKNKKKSTRKSHKDAIPKTNQEKTKCDALVYQPHLMGTTKWHIVDDTAESAIQQSGKTEIDIVVKESCSKYNEKCSDVHLIKKTNPNKEHTSSINLTGNTSSTVDSPNNVHLDIVTENNSHDENKSVSQSDEGATSQEKHDSTSGVRVFSLKRIKIRTFAKLKRRISEKLRCGVNSEEKIMDEVINLIKKIYMSDDISLQVTLRLLENINKHLLSKLKK